MIHPPLGLVRILLHLIGWFTITAFAAVVMPDSWIQRATQWLGFPPFPEHPIAFYLARHVSAFYALAGMWVLYLAMTLPKHRHLLNVTGVGVVILGIAQAVLDLLAGMPAWWTWGESLSTVAGGLVLFWMAGFRQPSPHPASER